MRHAPAQDYLNIKAAVRDLVALCGGAVRAAGLTRTTLSRLSEAMSPAHMERFPAIDQVYDLELECGQPVVTRLMADALGFDLVPREAVARPQSIHQHFAGIVVECGDVEARLAEALADGKVDEAERQTLIKEATQAIDRLVAFRTSLSPLPRKVAG